MRQTNPNNKSTGKGPDKNADRNAGTNARAVIYCRVSSVAQVAKGSGIASQETRCREFARMKGYEVAEVFSDEAVSGGLIDRPGIQAMLSFLRAGRTATAYVVLIDDISRLARDIKAHLELRGAIAATGARLESPSIEFGEDSDSILVENLLASVSQHMRMKGAEQTRNRMRARVMNGYWPFITSIGYRHEQTRGEGRVLVRDEPVASIIQEGLEGFASGRFQLQVEVKRFFESHPLFPKTRDGVVRNQLVTDILTKPLYAGYVEAPDWGVSLRRGRHEGLISFETFERIQERLRGNARVPARADLNAEFPLRGTLLCCGCGNPLTGYWATSKTGKRHAYYMCFAKGCARKGKSIQRDRIEGEFSTLLGQMTPAPHLFEIALAMFKRSWANRAEQMKALARAYEREMLKVEKQIETLLDRIVESGSRAVVEALEKRIGTLERQKLLLVDKRANLQPRQGAFEELFERACAFLSSPSKLWDSGKIGFRKLVLKLAFCERLTYCPETGFRTPKLSLPFKLLEDNSMTENKMADGVGFEPTVGSHLRRFSRPLP